MRIRQFPSSLRMTAAMATSTAAAFAWALFAREALPESPESATVGGWPSTTALVVADTTPDALIESAEGRDPFATHNVATQPTPNQPPPIVDQPILHVLGTVVDSGGASFALCQLGAAAPVVLYVGQRLGGYELRRVEKASAMFFTPDGGRVERRVPRAGV